MLKPCPTVIKKISNWQAVVRSWDSESKPLVLHKVLARMSPCAATIYIYRELSHVPLRASCREERGSLSHTSSSQLESSLFFNVTKGSYIYGAFTLDVKSVLNENLGGILGGILGGTQC